MSVRSLHSNFANPPRSIQPCPVQACTHEECTLTWGISNGIGLIGCVDGPHTSLMFIVSSHVHRVCRLSLNLFMTFTWMVARKRHFSKQPHQMKFCVLAGILHGVVGTLPFLIWKDSLPCECGTEEWCVVFTNLHFCFAHVTECRVLLMADRPRL